MINSLLQELSKRDNIVVQCNNKKVPSNSNVIYHSVLNSSNGLNSTNMAVNTNDVNDVTIAAEYFRAIEKHSRRASF